MKQLTVFFILLVLAAGIDLSPVNLDDYRSTAITVTVSGEVDDPGEIELPMYATVQDALDAAGVQEDADLSSLNMQTVLTDHDVLNVPERTTETEEKVSINTGSLEELCTLPGIGEGTAQKIIDYRETSGLFQNLEDLMNVKGIGEAKFETLKDRICL